MADGYEYDNETPEMRVALEKARAAIATEDAPAAPPAEEKPSKLTGDVPNPNAIEGPGNDGVDEEGKPIVGPGTLTEVSHAPPPPTPAPEPTAPPMTQAPTEAWARIKHGLEENRQRPPPTDSLLGDKMKAAGWAPKEPPPPPRAWEQLQGELKTVDEAQPPPAPPPAAPAGPDWAKLHADVQQTDKAAEEQRAAALKSAPPAPAPPPGPDWNKLQGDVQQAERSAEERKTVAAMLHAAAPGFVPPANIGAGDVEAAKAAIAAAQEKQRFEAQQAAQKREADAKLLATAKEQELNDPKSAKSQHARDALRPLFEMVGKVPEGFEGWSAADVEAHAKTLTPIAHDVNAQNLQKEKETAVEKEKAAAAAARKAEKDKDSAAEAKSLADEVDVLLGDPRAAQLHLTKEKLDQLNRKGLDGVRKELEAVKLPKSGGAPTHIKPGDYSSIPEEDRETVRAIAEGRAKAPDPGTRFGAKILSYVMRVKPDFDATRFGAYKHVVEHQATGSDVLALDVAREHIKTAKAAIPKNADPQFVNRVKQAVVSGAGDPEFQPFIIASTTAAHEIARINNIGDQAGKEMVERQLDAVQSPAQLAAAFDTFEELMKGKQHGLEHQREKVAPKATPSTSDATADTVTVRNKKDPSKSKLMSRAKAEALLAAPGGDDYEVKPAAEVK